MGLDMKHGIVLLVITTLITAFPMVQGSGEPMAVPFESNFELTADGDIQGGCFVTDQNGQQGRSNIQASGQSRFGWRATAVSCTLINNDKRDVQIVMTAPTRCSVEIFEGTKQVGGGGPAQSKTCNFTFGAGHSANVFAS